MAKKNIPHAELTRSIELLWGERHQTGRSGLSVERIVSTAIEIADAEGLTAVSMRRISDRLGSGTMSLYSYVPSRDDLLALMTDEIAGTAYDGDDPPAGNGRGWREALGFIAESNRVLYVRHPWLLDAMEVRPTLGPNVFAKYELELQPLDGIGLSDVEMDSLLTLVLTHVMGTVRIEIGQQRILSESGISDHEWWEHVAPVLDRVMPAGENFPLGNRVGTAAGEAHQAATNPGEIFRFGIDCIIGGVEALLFERSTND